jgi:hypothetical protein
VFEDNTAFEKEKRDCLIQLYVNKDCALFEKSSQAVFFYSETVFEIQVYTKTACDIESSRRLYVAIMRLQQIRGILLTLLYFTRTTVNYM